MSIRRLVDEAMPLLLAGLAAVIGFLLTTPGAVVNVHEFVRDASEPIHLYSTGFVPGQTGSSLAFYFRTLNDQGLLFAVLLSVGVLGVFGKLWREWLVVASFAVCYGGLMSAQAAHFDRNLVPELPALAILAAFGVATVADRLRSFFTSRFKAAVGAVVVLCGFISPLIASARVAQLLTEHPRAEAQAWIYRHVPRGSTVVVESYGPWIATKRYRLVDVWLLLHAPAAGRNAPAADLPATTAAIVVTELGSGRFLADPAAFPAEVAAYHDLAGKDCLRASYSDGPWIRVFTPCRK